MDSSHLDLYSCTLTTIICILREADRQDGRQAPRRKLTDIAGYGASSNTMQTYRKLITANHILHHHGVVDGQLSRPWEILKPAFSETKPREYLTDELFLPYLAYGHISGMHDHAILSPIQS